MQVVFCMLSCVASGSALDINYLLRREKDLDFQYIYNQYFLLCVVAMMDDGILPQLLSLLTDNLSSFICPLL